MSRPKKILAIVGASLVGLILVLIIGTMVIVQTPWFSNFVREKIIASVEESTGGNVELGSFHFDPWHLTVTIRNFVLHGTEPKTADPLARVDLLEIHLKLFSGIKHTVDLAYIGIQKPQIDLIVFPDGKTNIPQPKVQSKSSSGNGLETIIDLKIGQFQIQNGLIEYLQQKTAFSGRGENLRALLNYNVVTPSYQGNLSIDPLIFTEGQRPPLNVHVNLPIAIEKDAVRLANASFKTDASTIAVNASLQQMNAPVIDAKVNANVSLPEVQRSFDVPIDSSAKGAPSNLNAELSAHIDQKSNTLQVQTAHLALGRTTFQASGSLRDPANPNGAARFNANLDLAELGELLKVTSTQARGAVLVNGNARLDAQNNYLVNGTINSRDVSIRSGTTHVSGVDLYTPFHADPYLISLDGLKLDALGGSVSAKLFIEKMQTLSLEGTLKHFSLPVLTAVATGKRLGYDGAINGALRVKGDLKAKGTTGFDAQTALTIVPGTRGVPVSGRMDARYAGASDTIDVGDSYLAFPNSRLTLAGALNKTLNVKLVSHNLNDFLPAANFGASKPETSLPVTLEPNGLATLQAQITGALSTPHIASHLTVSNFALQQRAFNNLSLDLAASPSSAAVTNGTLTRNALRATFDASIGLRKWTPEPRSPLAANVVLRNASVTDLLALAGESTIPASGDMSADIHVNGTYGDPLGQATLQVANGTAYDQPFNRLYAQVNLADQLITLSPLELASDAGNIDVTGRFEHPRDSFTIGNAQVHVTSSTLQLSKLKKLQQESPGSGGTVQLSADAALSLREVDKKSTVDIQNVSADVNARALRVQNQDAGDLSLIARTNNRVVKYQLTSNFGGSNVNVRGNTSLATDYPTTADASIQNLSVQKVLSIAGQSTIPASGTLSANAHVSGTMKAPNANLDFTLAKATAYEETINRLTGSVHYSDTLAEIPSLELDTPAGNLTASGTFTHPAGDFNAGSLKLNVKSTDIQLARIQHVRQQQPTLAGTVHLAADLSANLREQGGSREVLITNLNADASTNALRMHDRDLGKANLTAKTTGSNLNFKFDSDIAQSQIHGAGRTELSGQYPVQATLTFSNIRYANLAPFIEPDPNVKPAFDALVEGEASVNGPMLDTDAINARLQLTHLMAQTSPTGSPTGAPAGKRVAIENQGPIILALNHSVLNIQQLHIAGAGTKVNASGTVNLKNDAAPMNLAMDASVDLTVLQDISRDFYSSGNVSMNAAVHGTFAQPVVNGRVELKNANVNYAQAPNGISNANGTILLSGTGATIQNITADSGGGKIVLTGFAGLTGRAITYNVKAAATRVRVRYSGISITSDAAISVTGNSNRSLVSGNVTVRRIAYNSSSDAGSLLSSFASTPPSSPTAPSPFLTGMRLNIHILTAPDLRVITTYANRLNVEANLTVRGTAIEPGMLGRVVITDGQLVFFGNTYTVNTGVVNFFNPTDIQPVLNVSLETLAQGVDVTLGVSGTMENLQLNYRSDPPLTFEQIVQLLATNTTPNDPNIVANQPPAPQQSMTQMGESAVLGQAVANPLASRVQRVFGLSQFKIDPSFSGSNGQPSARVTLQQKIANNITFTYITDVTQTNSEIVRVQWDLTPKFSAVGLRDFNGNVSVEFFYKFKVR